MPSSVHQYIIRLADCPVKPHGVVSGSHPQNSTISECSVQSFIVLVLGDIMPCTPLPQMCLAPQYHPSQLSGLRTESAKPPMWSSSTPGCPCGVCTVLHSPCPSPWNRTALLPYC